MSAEAEFQQVSCCFRRVRMSESKVRILALTKERDAQAQAVRGWLGARAEFIFDETWDVSGIFEKKPDLLLLTHFYLYESVRCIDEARKRKVPTLFLQDGILEWRCQYENPLFGSGGGAPQHQPVLTDKIACIGSQSARQIVVWGNAGKVEVTGMPRLDALFNRQIRPLRKPGKCILVMTARKPWFDKNQETTILHSLLDLKEELQRIPNVEIIWRLTRGVSERLGVENNLKELDGAELPILLEAADAVITTPSTASLEAMILGRPTAFLDYFNAPHFVPTAWSISAREQITPVVKELLDPPVPKMLFQRDHLRDTLRMDKPAAECVGELIMKMSCIGREARAAGSDLHLPAQILNQPSLLTMSSQPPLSEMYPEHEVFRIPEVTELQSRLARAERDNFKLKEELSKRHLGYWISKAGYFFYSLYKQACNKVRIRR